jgi:hypothetical protein
MRVIGEIPHPQCKISIFRWNQKYLIKIEQDMCEQTFKVPETEVADDSDLKSRISEEFIAKAVSRFKIMHEDLSLILD